MALSSPGGTTVRLPLLGKKSVSGESATLVTIMDSTGAIVASVGTAFTNPKITTGLQDANGNVSVNLSATASAVNGLAITNAATGNGTTNPVTLAPAGTDAAVALSIAPKGAAGVLTLGLATGTGDILLGSSSGAQSVKIANGAGAPTVNVANVSTAGATITVAGAATAAAATDTINIGTGNAAATGFKKINIGTGTPGTSGNNWITLGGGATSSVTINASFRTYQAENFIATESGANNALVATLTDASGTNVTVAAGLFVTLVLAHTLQAGANTFNLNGSGAKSILSCRNSGNNIGTAYAATGIMELLYDGTAWRDMSQ